MRSRHAVLGVFFTALLVPSASVRAQEAQDIWKVQVELGFNGAAGNSSFSILRTGVKVLRAKTDMADVELTGLVRYGQNDEKVIANDQRSTLKLDLWPDHRWSPFIFVDASRDVIRKLDFRSNGGAGAKYSFWNTQDGSGSLSAALIWDYQNFHVEPGSGDRPYESHARWSVRSKIEKTVGGTTTFEQTAFYQPVWNRSSDWLLTVTNTVSTKVLSNASLAVEHEYLHDSVPPQDVLPDDQKFSVILKLAL